MDLIGRTILPTNGEYLDPKAGIDLDTLTSLKNEWIDNFDWETEQQKLNKFHHFTAEIENLTVHFIHEKSHRPGAIPLILNHGWPGSFLEFIPLIDMLKEDFHIIIPSLPGFAFSSAPPATWTVHDTARVFNTLMTKGLGYSQYATYGTDWGSGVSYSLYENFNTSVRAGHFSFLPFFPLNSTQLAAENISLSPLEEFEVQRLETWSATGNGYFVEQSTEPNSIGFALYDNPIGQLSYIGGKFIQCKSQLAVLHRPPNMSKGPILKLEDTLLTTYTKPPTDAPMLFSAFKYNVGYWPPKLVAQVGNLVHFENHEFGGHFPGLDNPVALAKDLKEIKKYWK
ncbi:hypothetical protein IL306_006040 [Fusarium sp. DS 682]|nr:hypothetical protein IL306_006040 [Fusarium sp. DS 682]